MSNVNIPSPLLCQHCDEAALLPLTAGMYDLPIPPLIQVSGVDKVEFIILLRCLDCQKLTNLAITSNGLGTSIRLVKIG